MILVSDVISTSSYGNPGIGSCGFGIVSEGGVIGFGDEGVGVAKLSIKLFIYKYGPTHEEMEDVL